MFRKGKALGEQGFFEKAVKVLENLKSKNPAGISISRLEFMVLHTTLDKDLVDQEIARLKVIDNEREKLHKQKLKGI